jgi:hypothetical protein
VFNFIPKVYNAEVVDVGKPRDMFILLIARVELFIILKYRLSTFNGFLGVSEEV